jgi:apolipoprotein N-acyltransferase
VARDSLLTGRARFALLAAYGVANFLAFPHPIGERVLDLGMLCGWLSPALLILGLRGLSPRSAAKTAFVAGTLAQSAIVHWIYIVSVSYGHAAPPMGVIGILGIGAHAGLFTAVFAMGWALLGRRRMASPWTAALLWTVLEYARTAGPLGFPWAVIGYTQHANPALLPWAAYTGVYGMSFAVVLVGATLAAVAMELRTERRFSTSSRVALAGVAVIAAVGFSLRSVPEPGAETIRVAVLQGNIEQGVKWNPAWAERTLAIYEDLSRRAAEAGAEVIVFPETAMPGALNSDPVLRGRMADLARETGAAYVVGGVAVERRVGQRSTEFFDSAFAIHPDGSFGDRYDKSQLVPFGEYVPFDDWLRAFFEATARGMATERVSPGPGPRALSIPTPAGSAASLTAGVPICYELLFPDLTRRFVSDGAVLLLAITNDAWYGRTGAPYQFLAMTAVRSAENGVWTARAANTGVSAIIDSGGRVRSRTRIFERDLLVGDLPLRALPAGGTFYARHGDLFAYGCWVAIAALAVRGVARKAREERR